MSSGGGKRNYDTMERGRHRGNWTRTQRMNNTDSALNFSRNEVIPQAEITAHIWPSPDLYDRYRLSQDKDFINSPHYPNGDQTANQDTNEGDLVFTWKRHLDSTWNHTFGRSGGFIGFSSLNGLSVEPFKTFQHMEEAVSCIGPSKSHFSPGNPSESVATGFAARSYGSTGTTNVFVESTFVGDDIAYFFPDPTKIEELKRFSHGELGLSPTNKGRLTPLLKPFDHSETAYNEQILAATAINLNEAEPNFNYLDNERDCHSARMTTPREEASAALQHFIMGVVQAAVTLLVNRNILIPNFEPTASDNLPGKFKVTDNLTRPDNGSLNVSDFFKGQLPATNEKYSFFKKNGDDERRVDQELFLSNLLGLSRGTNKPEDTATLRNDILKTVFSGDFQDMLYMPLFGGLLEELKSEAGLDMKQMDSEIVGGKQGLINYTEAMLNTRHRLHQSMVYINKVTCGQMLMGTAASSYVPGEPIIDMLSNIFNYRY